MNHRTKILVVDDDHVMVNATRRALESVGYETLAASDGEKALQAVREFHPDLALVDVNMPKMDGFELCRRVKADPALADIFIILLSGERTSGANYVEGLNQGADGYIGRPIANRELVARVEALLRIQTVEKALRQSENRFRILAEAAPVGIFRTDVDGKTNYVNPRWSEITQVSFEFAMGDGWQRGIHPEDCATLVEAWQKAAQTQTISRAEYRFLHKDGTTTWVMGEAVPQKDAQGLVIEYIGTITDITERKRQEAAEREQRTLAEALRDTAAALNSTLKFEDVLDRILENVSHVVPHDAVDIILLDAARQVARLARHRNMQTADHVEELPDIQFSIDQTRNLREILLTGAPLIISDTRTYEGWVDTSMTAWIRANMVVPITVKGEIIGFLSLDSNRPGAFTPQDAGRLQAFADQAAIAIENARLYAEAQELAITDSLTGVFNRRGLFQLGEREVERALRFQHPLAVVMLDVDYFKQVNDGYGHLIGDRVLRRVAACCRGQVRNVDVVARYGGEEFILLLTETDLISAAQIAERLRDAVEKMDVTIEPDENAAGENVKVTISLGVVSLLPDTQDLADLIKRVDQALYAAKAAGRNCVALGNGQQDAVVRYHPE